MLKNGQSIPLDSIPESSFEQFRSALLAEVSGGARVVNFSAQPIGEVRAILFAVLADDAQGSLRVLKTRVDDSYPSLTPDCPQVHMFEREMWENLGLTPVGHPWLKSVRSHDDPANHPFFTMVGQDVHEVAVGPVHAGVIEPGHFRFQCTGEVVQHLEVQMGYQHRGVESAMVGGPHKRTMSQIETVAGDTTIGHAIAYCEAIEALSGTQVPERAQALRALALELERLANHVGDLGAIANDIGYLPPAAFCGRLRGDLLNVTTTLTGSRMGRSFVRPGGVTQDIDDAMLTELRATLDTARSQCVDATGLLFDSRSSVARMTGTGVITADECRELGIVGVAARASGVEVDVRMHHPTGWYESAGLSPVVETTLDSLARVTVRRNEIEQSFAIAEKLLKALPGGPIRVTCADLKSNSFAVSMVEGWRGEIVHLATTDADGRFATYKIVDPSFRNWSAVTTAMRGEQISDFPLCNKSFNLSYCGFDL
ncbi:MAG: NADH-quinone oxidoreductase subunit C [Chloroflexi bacterium]|nr:NADH-quinone oxidoreductase subunit C [Chloroflexota bacterium]